MSKEVKTETKTFDLSAMDRAELEKFAMENHKKRIALEAELEASAIESHKKRVALEAELEKYKELLRKNRKNMFGSSSERHISDVDSQNRQRKTATIFSD